MKDEYRNCNCKLEADRDVRIVTDSANFESAM